MKRSTWKSKHKITPKIELVSAEADNPYFSADHAVSKDNPKKIRVSKNLRESAIETLFARGKLDEAQKKAADRFRATWEACGGAGAGAMDYSRTHVDGGGARDPISERVVTAASDLRECRMLLGARNYALVCKVCGQGLSFGDISTDQRAKLTMADNLRDSLNDLAQLYGIATQRAHGL
jgi:hypothetical protein